MENGEGLWDVVDSAIGVETGFTLNEWTDVFGAIWNICSQQDGTVKQLERSELVSRVATDLGWDDPRFVNRNY